MIETIQRFFLEIVGRELSVFFCAMLPIIELRGAIPLGWSLGLNPFLNYLLSVLGNMLPVPLILIFSRVVLNFMKKFNKLGKLARWLEAKAEKNKEKIMKHAFWGLVVFVAIPLPGTGAWTGSLVAAVFHMPLKKSILAVLCGVLIAGVIMSLISLISYLISIGISLI